MVYADNLEPAPNPKPESANISVATINLKTIAYRTQGNSFILTFSARYIEEIISSLNNLHYPDKFRHPFEPRDEGDDINQSIDGQPFEKSTFGNFSFKIKTRYGECNVNRVNWYWDSVCITSGSIKTEIRLFATVAIILNGVSGYPDVRDGLEKIKKDVEYTLEYVKSIDQMFQGTQECEIMMPSENDIKLQIESEIERLNLN